MLLNARWDCSYEFKSHVRSSFAPTAHCGKHSTQIHNILQEIRSIAGAYSITHKSTGDCCRIISVCDL